jgi:hypothetical protein
MSARRKPPPAADPPSAPPAKKRAAAKKPAPPKTPVKRPPKVVRRKQAPLRLRNRAASTAGVQAGTPEQAEAVMVAAQEAPMGMMIMEELMAGASIEAVSARTGLPIDRIQQMVANFATFNPEEYRNMVDGMRGFLGRVLFADLMHWRPLSRTLDTVTITGKDGTPIETPNFESQKIAVASYHSAKSDMIKVFGLAKQTVEVTQTHSREPLPLDELQDLASRNAKLAAAVTAVGLLPPSKDEKR